MADAPVKYIVKEKSLVGNEIFEAGAEVTLPEGTWPGHNMEPTCDVGRALQAEYNNVILPRQRAELQKLYGENNSPMSLSGDMAALSQAIAAAVADAMASQKADNDALVARIAELEAAAKATPMA